jgi:hypothetical protein
VAQLLVLVEELSSVIGGWVVFLSLLLMGGGPVALLIWLARLLIAGQRGGRDGLVWGLGTAAWASASWLIVPYCGAYLSLPALLALEFVGVGREPWWLRELVVHGLNFVMWPSLGWLLFQGRQAVLRR